MKFAVCARLRTFCRVEGGAVKATTAMRSPSDVGISEADDISLTRFVQIVHRRPSVFVTSGGRAPSPVLVRLCVVRLLSLLLPDGK